MKDKNLYSKDKNPRQPAFIRALRVLKIGIIACGIGVLAACSASVPKQYTDNGKTAHIYPDYADVTVPPNIAPLHFEVMEQADKFITRLSTKGGAEWVGEGYKALPSEADWHKLVEAAKGGSINVEIFAKKDGAWQRFQPFAFNVADEEIDPYISYRLIAPSYVTYEELTINQRNLTNYDQTLIYNNMLNATEKDGQCINCHSYQAYNPQRMQFHVRQHLGGTMINYDGKLTKVNLKCDSTISAGVYPAWHPTLKLIAYSTNNTGQSFHTRNHNKVEVEDTKSDLILYDIDRNEVMNVEARPDELEIFPAWSPDGKYLYYCSAHFVTTSDNPEFESIKRYKEIKYSVYRKAFDAKTRTFGPREMVFDAAAQGKSATLPRISPDGRYLLFTLGEYGCFHIWHKDADLYLTDLQTMQTHPLAEVNSPDVESYHSWSSNGRWIILSSRRYDGGFTRPFIAYFDKNGRASKPFELPQDDPDFHRQFLKSYNIPEFMSGPVTVSPQEFASAVKRDAVGAKFKSGK